MQFKSPAFGRPDRQGNLEADAQPDAEIFWGTRLK